MFSRNLSMQKGVVSPNVIGGDAKVGDVVLHSLPQAIKRTQQEYINETLEKATHTQGEYMKKHVFLRKSAKCYLHYIAI